MLNGDLLLKNEAESKGKGKKGRKDENENEAGFHFIAFVPIEYQLWKLDGLERQPVCLGEPLQRPVTFSKSRNGSSQLRIQAQLLATGLAKQNLRLKRAWLCMKKARSNSPS